jgi:hypothetical protein
MQWHAKQENMQIKCLSLNVKILSRAPEEGADWSSQCGLILPKLKGGWRYEM